MARFTHRFVLVTETQHVVKRNTFAYRSFADRRDAYAARDRSKPSVFRRAYVVDTQNAANVILP